jgi:hypothetical protein
VDSDASAKRRVTLDLSDEVISWIDGLKAELGLRSRGAILEHVLGEIRRQGGEEDEEDRAAASSTERRDELDQADAGLDEGSAIVLIRSGEVALWDTPQDPFESPGSQLGPSDGPFTGRSRDHEDRLNAGETGGIQLPGFVRRQARAFGRSLQAEAKPGPVRGLALISDDQLNEALLKADQHWREIYGQAPTEPALEAAMVWLARDVWPQSDHSDGRPFTWSLTQRVVQSFAPGWTPGDASLERVITAAGVLEDPFSGSTLSLRVPTLITRFVQRHRSRQKRATSFEAIDQTMSVHGALRLLQLPTTADRPYTLQEIREAYREQAQNHHPDAGGSADAMRRLNEAYQFLKERYRRPN